MSNQRISLETNARIAEYWPAILSRIAAGEQIGALLPDYKLSRDMVRAFIANTPQSREEWNEAREASADAIFERIMEIANNPGDDPKAARVTLQALQWAAGVRNPRVYGNRATVDLNVKTVDLTRIIQDANARLAAYRDVTPLGIAALL